MEIMIKPLTPELINDYFDFFDYRVFPDDSPFYPCYCNAYNMSLLQIKEQLFARLQEYGGGADVWKRVLRESAWNMVNSGKIKGYLAYHDGISIGWCNANDRLNYYRVGEFNMDDIPEDERKMGIAVTITANCSLNGSRSKQIKISVPSDREVNILFLRYQVMQELVKAFFYLRSTLYVSMPEKANCVNIHCNSSYSLLLPYIIHLNVHIFKPTRILFYSPIRYIIIVTKTKGGGFMEVGKKLHKLREDKKMSMYRLTQLTGVPGHHIKGIEEGTRQPTIETLNRLAVALGSSLAEMFNDDTKCTYLTEKKRHLIENFRRLSDEKAEALLNMSDVLNK